VKVLIEIDTDEIVSKMLELGAGEYMFSEDFWEVMAELYPPVITEIHEEITRLSNAVQAVADAGRTDPEMLKRAWFTAEELNEKFGGNK
jgi:tRNA(Phe) wybutosine-synthesizing methylase Tyw3